jgi:hypothetical protein
MAAVSYKERMISVWHLAAVCCLPIPNPRARFREQEIFCQVDVDIADHAKQVSNGRRCCRSDGTDKRSVATQVKG